MQQKDSAAFSADFRQTIRSEISNDQCSVERYEIIEKCQLSVESDK